MWPYAPDPGVWRCPASRFTIKRDPGGPPLVNPDADGNQVASNSDGLSYAMESSLPDGEGGVQAAWVNGKEGFWVNDVESPLRFDQTQADGRYVLLFDTNSRYAGAYNLFWLVGYGKGDMWAKTSQNVANTSGKYEYAFRHPGGGEGGGGPNTGGKGRNVLFFDGHVGTFSRSECGARDWVR